MDPGRGHQYVISFTCPSVALCITSWPGPKSLRFLPLLIGEAVIVPSEAFAQSTYRSRSLKQLSLEHAEGPFLILLHGSNRLIEHRISLLTCSEFRCLSC